MRKLLALLLLCFVAFLYINRFRVFLRDPIAGVSRDGVKVGDVKVMINYPNDVLLLDNSRPAQRLYLVQHWNMAVGMPSAPLKCFQGVACMTDADQAAERVVTAGSRGKRSAFEGVTMTNRQVEFVDEDGALVVVTIR